MFCFNVSSCFEIDCVWGPIILCINIKTILVILKRAIIVQLDYFNSLNQNPAG